MVSLLLAVLAAGCNAFSSVMQRKANIEEQDEQFSLRLVVRIILARAWLIGFVAMIASFLLQATALDTGELSAVQPVLVLDLPLTLILGAVMLQHPLQLRSWLSAAVMAAGLALFIAVLDPHGGSADHVSTPLMLAASAATIGGIVALVLAGRSGPRRSRAAFYGAAAGSGFGLTASLIKVAVTRLSGDGPGGLFSAWETYGAAAMGVASVGLVQAALHSGTLVTAQPGITLLDPLVSLLWGTVVLDETTRTGPILVLAGVGAAMIVVAAMTLARDTATVTAELEGVPVGAAAVLDGGGGG